MYFRYCLVCSRSANTQLYYVSVLCSIMSVYRHRVSSWSKSFSFETSHVIWCNMHKPWYIAYNPLFSFGLFLGRTLWFGCCCFSLFLCSSCLMLPFGVQLNGVSSFEFSSFGFLLLLFFLFLLLDFRHINRITFDSLWCKC